PWKDISNFIKQHAPSDILTSMEVHKPKVVFCSQSGPEAPSEAKTISAFQGHIVERIKLHAKEVERNWIGSATHIQAKLEDVLSQVWRTIREDTSISEKSQPNHSTSPPLGAIIIRPPAAFLVSYSYLESEEFLNRNDFGHVYPPELKPPSGHYAVRCLFCDTRYKGAGAESLWRQHVTDRHDFVVSEHDSNAIPQYDSVWADGWSDTARETVHRGQSMQEIFDVLLRHGCVDLSSQMGTTKSDVVRVAAGGSGDIWKGELFNGTRVAIKTWRASIIDASGYKVLKRSARELHLWSKMKHENVHELMGIILFRGKALGMVSEWMENGDLHEYLRRNPQADRLNLSLQVASGLTYVHSCNMVHGDVKAPNVLVSSDGVAKLTDFGSSIMPESSLLFSATASDELKSLRWAAPELILNESLKTKSADVYSLGM
ncbi:hypothetical protein FRC11_013864, partial [Ceratobasidium sp. 423]